MQKSCCSVVSNRERRLLCLAGCLAPVSWLFLRAISDDGRLRSWIGLLQQRLLTGDDPKFATFVNISGHLEADLRKTMLWLLLSQRCCTLSSAWGQTRGLRMIETKSPRAGDAIFNPIPTVDNSRSTISQADVVSQPWGVPSRESLAMPRVHEQSWACRHMR